jgi:hypothetical protein
MQGMNGEANPSTPSKYKEVGRRYHRRGENITRRAIASNNSISMLHQRDNFLFGQRDSFRFLGVQSFFLRKEDDSCAEGTNHIDSSRA